LLRGAFGSLTLCPYGILAGQHLSLARCLGVTGGF
jgi:hypothetical protein